MSIHRLACLNRGRSGRGRHLLLSTRVDASGQQTLGIVSRVPGVGQGHVRVQAQRQHLFLPPEAVLPTPALGAGHGDVEVEATSVGQLLGLVGWLRAADRDVGQGYGVSAFRGRCDTPRYTPTVS